MSDTHASMNQKPPGCQASSDVEECKALLKAANLHPQLRRLVIRIFNGYTGNGDRLAHAKAAIDAWKRGA